MTLEQMDEVEEAFARATRRADAAGFDFIELHPAHGYLCHSFYYPLSNVRTDTYGGSLENRLRFTLRIAARLRKEWPVGKPLFVRISASDHAEGPEKDDVTGEWKQWGVEQSTELCRELQKLGVDLVDISSGGNWSPQKIAAGPGYQVHFAQHIKAAIPTLLISTVGLRTDAHQAESIISPPASPPSTTAPDVIRMGREFLRDVDFPLKAAETLGVAAMPANQYARAWTRMVVRT